MMKRATAESNHGARHSRLVAVIVFVIGAAPWPVRTATPSEEMGVPEPYLPIIQQSYSILLKGKDLTPENLKQYFDRCFVETLRHFNIFECWVCVDCLHREKEKSGQSVKVGYGFGEKPAACPVCGSRDSLYQGGTFQARASKAGEAFENAFLYLAKVRWKLGLEKAPPFTQTHDFAHTGGKYVIEAKGSPETLEEPSGEPIELPRAGMSRTDTIKKAESNYKEFQRKNPGVEFYIITNVMPADGKSKNYSSEFLSHVIDVTNPDQLTRWAERLLSLDR